MKLQLLFVLASLSILVKDVNCNKKKAVMCYFGSWSTYRWSHGHFDVEDIDPFLCTHLVFGFAGLDENSYTIKALDPYNELYDNWGKGAYQRFTGLKTINPTLKTLLAIGGWNEGATKYSQMVATPNRRQLFIQSALEMVLEHNFDGLDLDWEYPGGREDSPGLPEDKVNFASLLKEMKPVFDKHGLLLTAAVSAGKNTIDRAYDVPVMSQTLDFINVMSYDFHGWWGNHTFTGHNSPLFARSDEMDPSHPGFQLSTDFAIRYWQSLGAPADKLLLGIGAYGRGFNLANPSDNGLYAPATSAIDPAMYTSSKGFWGYNEFCEKQLTQQSQWTVVHEQDVVAPYAFNGRQWLGYEDEKSVVTKVQYIKDNGLAGAMVWSIDTDDFHGFCTGKKFGLIATIDEALYGQVPTGPPTTSTEPTMSTTNNNGDVTTSPNNGDPHPICGTTPGLKADPEDCAWYYNCYPDGNGGWLFNHLRCDGDLLFDAQRLLCNWPDQVQCQDGRETTTTTTTIIKTTSDSLTTTTESDAEESTTTSANDDNDAGHPICGTTAGLKPDPKDCEKFYNCHEDGNGGWRMSHMSCAGGLRFDTHGLFCNWPHAVDCDMRAADLFKGLP